MKWIGSALLAVLLLALAAFWFLFPVFELPQPDGPYSVGTRQFDMTDPARTGVLEDAPQVSRRILIRAWYPARDVDQLQPRPYFTARESRDQAVAFARNMGFPSFLYRRLRFVRTHSYEAAMLAATDRRFAVVIFSHGYWCWPGQNTALMEQLASHGYIVFSIGHPHDAATLEFADGTVIRTTPVKEEVSKPSPGMLAYWNARDHEARYAAFPQYRADFDRHRLMQSFAAWRADTRFLVDALQAQLLPTSVADLAAAADIDRIGFVGMSFGGTTSASACDSDVRCRAAVNLDGEEFDWSLRNRDIRMPLLMLHSGREGDFLFNDYAYESWDHAGERADVYRARVVGLKHLGLTDLPLSARMPVRERLYGKLDGALAVAAVNDFVLGFLDTHVRNLETGFPAVNYIRHPQVQRHDASGVRKWWQQRRAQTALAP